MQSVPSSSKYFTVCINATKRRVSHQNSPHFLSLSSSSNSTDTGHPQGQSVGATVFQLQTIRTVTTYTVNNTLSPNKTHSVPVPPINSNHPQKGRQNKKRKHKHSQSVHTEHTECTLHSLAMSPSLTQRGHTTQYIISYGQSRGFKQSKRGIVVLDHDDKYKTTPREPHCKTIQNVPRFVQCHGTKRE